VRVIIPIYPLLPFATAADVVCLAATPPTGRWPLSAALTLRDEHGFGLPRTVLISPVFDVSLSNPSIDAVYDPWLTRAGLLEFAKRWCGELPATDPMVSPRGPT
jgi:hypothetical protein